jgi:hypothetical protein
VGSYILQTIQQWAYAQKQHTDTPAATVKNPNRGIWTILFWQVDEAPNRGIKVYIILRNFKIEIKLESEWINQCK